MKQGWKAVLAILSPVMLVAADAVADSRPAPIPLPANNAPSSFALQTPAYGQDRLAPVGLGWQGATDADKGDEISYYLILSETLTFSPAVLETNKLPSTAHELSDPAGLLSGKRYFWRVKALDNHNGTTWCKGVGSFILHLDSDGDGLWDDFEDKHPGLDPAGDNDGDGLSNEQEQWAGTSPTNPASVFEVKEMEVGSGDGLVLRWSSASNRWYAIDRATNLLFGFAPLTNSILATPPQNVHTTAAAGTGPFYYRIRVED